MHTDKKSLAELEGAGRVPEIFNHQYRLLSLYPINANSQDLLLSFLLNLSLIRYHTVQLFEVELLAKLLHQFIIGFAQEGGENIARIFK